MAFCMNCGEQLPDGAKFCLECGTKLGDIKIDQTLKREVSYEGTIYKCPNCGDILDAYESVCETCGYERRGTKASSSVRELSRKLQEIEMQRPLKKYVSIWGHLSKTDEQKIDLIKSFAIPNSKEDILEFVVLAVSNIDPDAFSSLDDKGKDAQKAISNAWMAKFEQAYQKGQIMFGSSSELINAYHIYLEKKRSIRRQKASVWIAMGGLIVFPVILILAISIDGKVSSNKSKAEEQARLESLIIQAEIAIGETDYKKALMYADRIRYNGSSDEKLEKDWEIQREYWIDKVIDEAAKNGVILEKPDTESESTQDISGSAMKESVSEISIGYAPYSLENKNYLAVKQEFEDKGFTNVKTQGLMDLNNDLFQQDGKIDEITVGGENFFSSVETFPPDVEIVIYFHSFQDEKTLDN